MRINSDWLVAPASNPNPTNVQATIGFDYSNTSKVISAGIAKKTEEGERE